jgi:hypothetical protein
MIVIGCYYEWPCGKVVYVYGQYDNTLRWYTSTDRGETPFHLAKGWIERSDLLLLPDTTDRKLPYSFDLIWDIKTLNQLKAVLPEHEDRDDILALMAEYGFDLNEKPSAYRLAGEKDDNT